MCDECRKWSARAISSATMGPLQQTHPGVHGQALSAKTERTTSLVTQARSGNSTCQSRLTQPPLIKKWGKLGGSLPTWRATQTRAGPLC